MVQRIKTYAPSLSEYFRGIARYDLLTPMQEQEFGRSIQAKDEHATESVYKMVAHNLRFVVSLARPLCGRGLPFEDLISSGNFGLYRAAEGFDPSRGLRFASYAKRIVEQCMLEAIAESTDVFSMNSFQRKRNHDLELLVQHITGVERRFPTVEELVERSPYGMRSVRSFLEHRFGFLSLSDLDDDDEENYDPRLALTSAGPSPLHESIREQHTELTQILLASLSEREREVLVRYHGLYDHEEESLASIGNNLNNITREAVNQTRHKSYKKLQRLAKRLGYSRSDFL